MGYLLITCIKLFNESPGCNDWNSSSPFHKKITFHIFTHVHLLLSMQELTITLKSTWTNKQVEFQKDLRKEDRIEPVTFTADQEWYLCKHVVTESTTQHISNVVGPKENSDHDYPLYLIKCHVRRKSGYYFWNFAMVIVRKLFMRWKHYLKVLNY